MLAGIVTHMLGLGSMAGCPASSMDTTLHTCYYHSATNANMFSHANSPTRNFHDSNFRRSVFSNMTIADSDFSGADFRGAIFRNVKFENCNFQKAKFEGADLGGARFVASDLSQSTYGNYSFLLPNIAKCELSTVVDKFIDPADAAADPKNKPLFNGVDFEDLLFTQKYQDTNPADFPTGCYNTTNLPSDFPANPDVNLIPDFSNVVAKGATFDPKLFAVQKDRTQSVDPANTVSVPFQNSDLTDAIFDQGLTSQLIHGDFTNTQLDGASFHHVQFGAGTVLTGAKMGKALFTDNQNNQDTVFMRDVDLHGLDMSGVNLSHFDYHHVFPSTKWDGMILDDAIFYGEDGGLTFNNYSFVGTHFRKAQFHQIPDGSDYDAKYSDYEDELSDDNSQNCALDDNSCAQFFNSNFEGADFTGTDMRFVVLAPKGENPNEPRSFFFDEGQEPQFQHKTAILQNADFSHRKDLGQLHWINVDLSGANFSKTNWAKSQATNFLCLVNLDNADFSSSKLKNFYLESQSGDCGITDVQPGEIQRTSLKNANFSNAQLTDFQVKNADASGSHFEKSVFQRARAGTSSATFDNVNLTGAHLNQMYFQPTEDAGNMGSLGLYLRNVNATNADLSDAMIPYAMFTNGKDFGVTSDGLKMDRTLCVNCSFTDVSLSNATAHNGFFQGALFDEADLAPGAAPSLDFSQAYFTKAGLCSSPNNNSLDNSWNFHISVDRKSLGDKNYHEPLAGHAAETLGKFVNSGSLLCPSGTTNSDGNALCAQPAEFQFSGENADLACLKGRVKCAYDAQGQLGCQGE